ncbi:IPExxxVDY family protein [Aridibaculum aurantiacum]|uniref:IPExxxVDY family protein n=1 Tax=Aridibaculum aurantiacum TaxID=2810307 RepID=UPI001A95A8FA|nr:IPExxxVDY family protein [Aridibaculum aurantiacum]
MKLQLDNKALTDDFFADTHLLGIMAPIRNYLFAWQLNNHLGFQFRLNTDIDKQLRRKERQYFFSVYQHVENTFLSYYLYHNHCDGESLLPEFKHMDYLWLIKGDEVNYEDLQQLINSLKSLSSVQMVAELNNELIKNKQHLVF